VDWNRLLDITIGAIFGGSLTGTWLQVRHQRSLERNQRRERAAETLAALAEFVEDLNPEVLLMTHGFHGERLSELRRRYKEVRDPLLVLAVAHPRSSVRKLGRKLDTELASTWAWIVSPPYVVKEADDDTDRVNVWLMQSYRRTKDLVADFLDLF
jgi:hypothetical protein